MWCKIFICLFLVVLIGDLLVSVAVYASLKKVVEYIHMAQKGRWSCIQSQNGRWSCICKSQNGRVIYICRKKMVYVVYPPFLNYLFYHLASVALLIFFCDMAQFNYLFLILLMSDFQWRNQGERQEGPCPLKSSCPLFFCRDNKKQLR